VTKQKMPARVARLTARLPADAPRPPEAARSAAPVTNGARLTARFGRAPSEAASAEQIGAVT